MWRGTKGSKLHKELIVQSSHSCAVGLCCGGCEEFLLSLTCKSKWTPCENSWRRLNTDIPLAESTGAAGFEAQGM